MTAAVEATKTSSAASLPAGVVTSEDYRSLISACKAGGYALPAVNVTGTNSLNAVLEAAAAAKSDVIIQLSNGGARFFAGEGMKDEAQARILGAVSAARHVHLLAQHYGVCVVLHTDHANKKLVPWGEGMKDEAQARILGAVSAARHVHLLAQHYGVCVVLHTDHANKKLVPWVEG